MANEKKIAKDVKTNNKTFFKQGRNKRSAADRVEFLTDGQSNLLTEKTGIAKTKIKWVHCLSILKECLGDRIRKTKKKKLRGMNDNNNNRVKEGCSVHKQVPQNKNSYFSKQE